MLNHLLNDSNERINPATEAGQLNGGIKTLVNFGLLNLTTAGTGTEVITLHDSTLCSRFRFWLSPASGHVRVNPDGTAAGATSHEYDPSMDKTTIILATPAASITIYVDAASGYLNWMAGN